MCCYFRVRTIREDGRKAKIMMRTRREDGRLLEMIRMKREDGRLTEMIGETGCRLGL